MLDLIKIRKQSGLTQLEAASLLGMPHRTYVRYENNESYHDSYKYQLIAEELERKVRIDEDHGVLSLDKIVSIVVPILKKHNIYYCYLFGSYAKGTAKENSDVDLLVDTDITGMEFFKLVDELREELHKKVDLLRLKDLSTNNPIILEILKFGIRIS